MAFTINKVITTCKMILVWAQVMHSDFNSVKIGVGPTGGKTRETPV